MTSIFVAKLDFGVTQDELKSVFERFGKVNKVTIATDRETGKPRGFAFVEMFNEQEAESAIEQLDGFKFNGRPIAVKKADDRGSSKPQDSSNRSSNYNQQRSSTEQKPDLKSDYKRLEDEPKKVVPIFEAGSDNRKKDKKKVKEKSKDLADGRPKAQKMQAYKKSGKNNRFFDADDEDDFF